MFKNTAIALLSIALAANNSAFSQPQTHSYCGKLPRPYFQQYPSQMEGCWCGSDLRHVTISLNPPLKLGAACNLYWSKIDAGNVLINPAKESVTFDQYTQGTTPYGQLLLLGRLKIKGELIYSIPIGAWSFNPLRRLSTTPVAANFLGGFKLSDDHTLEEFGAETKVEENCLSAQATIEIQDIWLYIGDTDEAGAYPSKYRLSKVSKFQPCE